MKVKAVKIVKLMVAMVGMEEKVRRRNVDDVKWVGMVRWHAS